MFYILGCSFRDKLDPLRWTGTQDGPFSLWQNRLEKSRVDAVLKKPTGVAVLERSPFSPRTVWKRGVTSKKGERPSEKDSSIIKTVVSIVCRREGRGYVCGRQRIEDEGGIAGRKEREFQP